MDTASSETSIEELGSSWAVPKTKRVKQDQGREDDCAASDRMRDLPVVDVDPKGDVILQTVTTNIRVSSKVLSLASPVLDGMFSKKRKVLISSDPEDDVETLTLLCRFLHHRLDPEEVRTPVSMEHLVEFAKLGAKYRCIPAVKAQGRQWLRLHWETHSETSSVKKEDFVGALVAADLLDDGEMHRVAMRRIIGMMNKADFFGLIQKSTFSAEIKGMGIWM